MAMISAYQRRKQRKADRLWQKCKKLSHSRLIALFQHKDSMLRSAAVQELQVRDTKAVLRDALKLCQSKNEKVRECAALLLGQLTVPDTVVREQLVVLLQQMAATDPRACVRSGALFALGHRCSRGADPAVVLLAAEKGARDRSCNVRYATSTVMGHLGIPGAERVLLHLLRDKDKDVRDWAAFAVFMQENEEYMVYDTPEIRDVLLALTADPVESIRFEALRALGVLREKRAALALKKELLGNEEKVFFDLVTVAEQLGDPELIPVLETLQKRFADDENIIGQALETLKAGLHI